MHSPRQTNKHAVVTTKTCITSVRLDYSYRSSARDGPFFFTNKLSLCLYLFFIRENYISLYFQFCQFDLEKSVND